MDVLIELQLLRAKVIQLERELFTSAQGLQKATSTKGSLEDELKKLVNSKKELQLKLVQTQVELSESVREKCNLKKRLSEAEEKLKKVVKDKKILQKQFDIMSQNFYGCTSINICRKNVAVQVDFKSMNHDESDETLPDWGIKDENLKMQAVEGFSTITESLKAIAEKTSKGIQSKNKRREERRKERTAQSLQPEEKGMEKENNNNTSQFVYDVNSGMYYDHKSGYYYDSGSTLYYDPKTGTYFYYNHREGKYEFHSKIDLTQYQDTRTSCQKISEKKEEEEEEEYGESCSSEDSSEIEEGEIKERQKRLRKKPIKKEVCSEAKKTKEDSKQAQKETVEILGKCAVNNTSESDIMETDIFETTKLAEDAVIKISLSSDKSPNLVKEDQVANPTSAEEYFSGSTSSFDSDDLDMTEQEYTSTWEAACLPKQEDIIKMTDDKLDYNDVDVNSGFQISAEFSSYRDEPQPEETAQNWPPCIRVIVTKSNCLNPGHLFIVTCEGATIGRGEGNTVKIPDISKSGVFAEIQYEEGNMQYVLKCLSKRTGLFLNGKRLLQAQGAEPLSHDDILQVAGSELLLHIHPCNETCDDCEPGQVLAQIKETNQIKNDVLTLTKEERIQLHRKEIKNIKKKYGLENAAYVDNKVAISNPSYSDKAAVRRKVIGSDNPYGSSTHSTVSVHESISSENKGHKMLKKMGWLEGESLGKDNTGIQEPISAIARLNPAAGLGSNVGFHISLDCMGNASKKQKNWLMARKRFQKIDRTTTNLCSAGVEQTSGFPCPMSGG